MKPYPHQEQNVTTLLQLLAGGGGVGDLSDTGTGKTATAILTVERSGVLDEGYALIVVPKSLVLNWQDEWSRWYEGREVQPLLGPTRQRDKQLQAQMGKGKVFITNYHTVRALHKGTLVKYPPAALVADEVHRLKNRQSQIAAAFKRVPCAMRMGLTATPIDWKEYEFWSLLQWLDPVTYGSKPRGYNGPREYWPFWKWAGKYGEWRKGRWGYEYVGPRKDRIEELQSELGRYFVRTPRDPAMFPDVSIYPVYVDTYPRQWQMHQSLKKLNLAEVGDGEIMVTSNVAAQLVRMMQVADNPAIIGGPDQSYKAEHVLMRLESVRPLAVFSKYLTALDLLAPRLIKAGWRVGWITGRQNERDRRQAYEQLNDGTLDVVLTTYGAGGEGVNFLIQHMIMYDQPWSYKEWYQATSRPRRPSNKHPTVAIEVLIARHTIDHHVWRVLDRKMDVNNQLLIRELRRENPDG